MSSTADSSLFLVLWDFWWYIGGTYRALTESGAFYSGLSYEHTSDFFLFIFSCIDITF